tara:strand:- start:2970 stop:3200 length:231 start_codon:yes stop_codon:yes gene_type:complete
MKYKRIQKMIIKFLEQNGPANTRVIYEYVNRHDKNGIQSHALSNVLSKNPSIKATHTERVKGITDNSYELTVWKVD